MQYGLHRPATHRPAAPERPRVGGHAGQQARRVARHGQQPRIRKLEDDGLLVGYTVLLRPDAQTQQITAWMSITVEGNQTRAVIGTLLGEPGVAALHDTNGRWDLLAELRAGNLAELAEVLERVRLIKGIAGTETSIHLQTYKLS